MAYRTISTNTWQDPWFEALTPKAKLAFIYLWTNDVCNQAGFYRISERRMNFELGFKVSDIIDELKPKIEWFPGENVVWVKAFFKRQCANEKFMVGAFNCLCGFSDVQIQDFLAYNREYILSITEVPEDLPDRYRIHTLIIPFVKGIQCLCLSDTVSVTGSVSVSVTDILSSKPLDPIPFQAIISDLNETTGKKFDHKSKTTRNHIKARWNEGHRLPDFKTVHKVKFEKWGNDPKMVDYLRPSTLYGTKFGEYLAEKQTFKKPTIKTNKDTLLQSACEIKRGIPDRFEDYLCEFGLTAEEVTDYKKRKGVK